MSFQVAVPGMKERFVLSTPVLQKKMNGCEAAGKLFHSVTRPFSAAHPNRAQDPAA
jgi:hypothetical protein